MTQTDQRQSIVRTYSKDGKALPISRPDLSDEQVAGAVRMLLQDQINHEEICCIARERIMCLIEERDTAKAENERLHEAVSATLKGGDV